MQDWVLHIYGQLDKAYAGAQEFWVGLNARDDPTTWKWADGENADMSLMYVVTDPSNIASSFYTIHLKGVQPYFYIYLKKKKFKKNHN